MKKKMKISCFLLAVILGIVTYDVPVKADEIDMRFGSESYEVDTRESFYVGVYVGSEEAEGEFEVQLSYDPVYLEYVSGAEETEEGLLTLTGELDETERKQLLTFRSLVGGETQIKIEKAVLIQDEEEREVELSVLPVAPIAIAVEEEATLEHLYVNGIEVDGFTSDVMNYTLNMPYDIAELVVTGVATEDEAEVEVSDTALAEGENVIYVTVNGRRDTTAVYELRVNRETAPAITETETTATETTGAANVEVEDEKIPYGAEDEGDGLGLFSFIWIMLTILICTIAAFEVLFFYIKHLDKKKQKKQDMAGSKKSRKDKYEDSLEDSNSEQDEEDEDIEFIEEIDIDFIKKELSVRKGEDRKVMKSEPIRATVTETVKVEKDAVVPVEEKKETVAEKTETIVEKEATEKKIIEAEKQNVEATQEEVKQEPVISVQDVCMNFKVATQNVSGIKELVIQKLKGKISFRTLKALDHVSFDVMQGEVVGIIGTNGSGKSTLLKLVSGALWPTSGKVVVDRNKVQLLTLGTGFDMELTAKENVYLNGAIIGYDKEFIDEKYDSIVEFAELEGFMEEKVKNFSSGMVSRLGFAIATAAETPEILILDEVLSVGDEFFRKKSLARVKEMIHGGSTVLMVSHGMSTIIENCSKAVWIEKGELKMIGDPKVVCAEYRKYGNEK